MRPLERDVQDVGVTLPELLATFSLATDLGMGQPMEHMLRAWRIATHLGEHAGLSAEDRADLYYIAVLSWVGCLADTPEVAAWFGDDIAFRGEGYAVDFAGMPALVYMLRHAGRGSSALHRASLRAALLTTGATSIRAVLVSHCLSTSSLAERLGLGPRLCEAVQQFFTRWDGRGVPAGIGGEEISRPVRLFHLADVVDALHEAAGIDAALEVARAGRGRKFDPELVDVFCASAGDILDAVHGEPDVYELLALDPQFGHRLTGPALDDALEAVGDFTDLRSTFRAGHSRAVAALAGRAAELCGLPAAEIDLARRAGFVHDIGLHGIPATILDKPGPLTATETERLRMHAYYTERVLARSPALARVGAVAALAHERLDGSGYHRGLDGRTLPRTARILAAADAFAAMIEPRPHRPARTPKQAAAVLGTDVREGRLDADAVDAVLRAADQPRPRLRRGPAGLTPREIEVLVLIARGASTRQVARRLGISPKTAGTHVERIYAKTGASTRSTATLFALQNGLLDSLEPLGS